MVGGAFTAVILGLAAQQTLGNLFVGMVLLSARPFRVGERVRLSAGVTPLEIQRLLEEAITTPVRDRPQIHLEEVDGDEVVVRITATPELSVDWIETKSSHP